MHQVRLSQSLVFDGADIFTEVLDLFCEDLGSLDLYKKGHLRAIEFLKPRDSYILIKLKRKLFEFTVIPNVPQVSINSSLFNFIRKLHCQRTKKLNNNTKSWMFRPPPPLVRVCPNFQNHPFPGRPDFPTTFNSTNENNLNSLVKCCSFQIFALLFTEFLETFPSSCPKFQNHPSIFAGRSNSRWPPRELGSETKKLTLVGI